MRSLIRIEWEFRLFRFEFGNFAAQSSGFLLYYYYYYTRINIYDLGDRRRPQGGRNLINGNKFQLKSWHLQPRELKCMHLLSAS